MRPHTLRRTITIAACLYAFDGLIVGEGVIGFFAFLVVFLAGGIRILMAAPRKDRALVRFHAARVGIYFLMAVAVAATIYLHNRVASRRAERVIAACRQYEAKYQHLPDSLQDVVPEFLPSIPRAKYTVFYGDSTYFIILQEQTPHLLRRFATFRPRALFLREQPLVHVRLSARTALAMRCFDVPAPPKIA